MQSPRVMIIDGHALLHRAWHALPPLSTKSGMPVNAVYGFSQILLKALGIIKPTHVIATFDKAAPTFRHEQYAAYKATREKQPDELYAQIQPIQQILGALGIPIFEQDGIEADDLIATLCDRIHHDSPTLPIVIVTGDMDALQLVDEHTTVFTLKKGVGEVAEYDVAAVKERYDGLTPEQLVDYKALRGDPSDNIPGVKGIGEKGAIALLKDFDSIEGIYAAIDSDEPNTLIKEKTRALLIKHRDDAMMSKHLVTLVRNVVLDFSLEKSCYGDHIDMVRLRQLFSEFEFHSLVPRLEELGRVTVAVRDDVSPTDYRLVDTDKAAKLFLKEFLQARVFAVDTETTGLDVFDATLLGISISWKVGVAWYIPWLSMGDAMKSEIVRVLEDEQIKKVGHNIKYDIESLRTVGVHVRGVIFDTMLAAYLLNSGSRAYGLDALSFSEFGHQKISIESLIGKGKDQKSMVEVELGLLSNYACEDADYTWRLYERFNPKIQEVGEGSLLRDIEVPLIDVLVAMEENGSKLDVAFLKKLDDTISKQRDELIEEIYFQAGQTFNIDSPLQLKKILFEKLKLSPARIRKVKTGLSTAASELDKMKGLHPIIDLILDYRELTKLKNTYLEVLPTLVNKKTDRLHTRFNQTIAATGRLSSSNPNLQNIPIRTEVGREIRKAFIAEEGWVLVAADYSQLQLRIIAHCSQDEKMIAAFKAGEDIHTTTAAFINDVKPEDVTKDMRRAAKAINFGILYGMGPQGLSESSGITYFEARDFIDRYFETYAGVKRYLEQTIAVAKATGYVETMFARRRYLPDLKSGMVSLRNAAERMATNMPIQGAEADIMKLAMIAVYARIGKEFCDTARITLQVHDELVFEVKEASVKDFCKMLREEMEYAVKLSVPLTVDIRRGLNWGSMEPVL